MISGNGILGTKGTRKVRRSYRDFILHISLFMKGMFLKFSNSIMATISAYLSSIYGVIISKRHSTSTTICGSSCSSTRLINGCQRSIDIITFPECIRMFPIHIILITESTGTSILTGNNILLPYSHIAGSLHICSRHLIFICRIIR